MKFRSPLIEGVLLKRNFRFLVDIVLCNKRRRTVYCPNLGPLLNCDVLGTRIWFSPTHRLSQGYLDILELAEVNEGGLVAVNPEYSQMLVREGIHQGIVEELKDYRFLQSHINSKANNIELLLKENGEQCFIHIESVFFGDDRGEGFIPESLNQSVQQIQELITQRELGNRAVLFYCVQHSRIHSLRLNESIHPLYCKVVRLAALSGVEILAYRTHVSLQEVKIELRIPLLLSEDMMSR